MFINYFLFFSFSPPPYFVIDGYIHFFLNPLLFLKKYNHLLFYLFYYSFFFIKFNPSIKK